MNNIKIIKKLFVIIIAILSCVVVYFQSGRILPLIDYSYQIENAYRIYIGQIPYKDFIIVLPPGVYVYMALIMKIFGLSNIFQTIFLILFSIIIVFTTYYILEKISKNHIVNKILLLPLIVSGYSIYPFSSYDISATLFMLLGWTMIWHIHNHKNISIYKYLFTGILITLPSFFKQNTGYIYTIFSFSLLFYEAYISKEDKWKKILLLSIGTITPYFFFVVYLFLTNSIKDFIFQTYTFPSRVRNPITSFQQVISDCFKINNFIYYLSTFFILVVSLTKKFSNITKEKIISLLIIFPTIIFPIIYSFLIFKRDTTKDFSSIFKSTSNYYFSIWYVVIGILGIYVLKKIFFKINKDQKTIFYLLFSIEIITICFSSFLSQGIEGSTYGIYPLFVIMLSLILRELSSHIKNIKWDKYIIYISIVTTIVLSIYIADNTRLSYFSKWGSITKASIPEIKGLATPGPWIEEMENMIQYTNKNIPSNEMVVSIPGEDPFYYLSRREPPLRFFQYYPSTLTYSSQEYANMIIEKKIKWILIKNHTQFDYWINSDNLLSYIKPYCGLYSNIPGYNIYKCKYK